MAAARARSDLLWCRAGQRQLHGIGCGRMNTGLDRNVILITMADSTPPDKPASTAPPARPTLASRLQPWAELLYKALLAAGAALALLKAL